MKPSPSIRIQVGPTLHLMYRFYSMDAQHDAPLSAPAAPLLVDAPAHPRPMVDSIPPRPAKPDKMLQGIAELTAMAYAKAPQCGGSNEPCLWLTVAESSRVLGIQKSILSSWATKGYVACIKGSGNSDHRLLHLTNCLAFVADSMRSYAARADGEDIDSAPNSPNPPSSPRHEAAEARAM